MGTSIAPQLVGYYLPGLTVMSPKKAPKKAFGGFAVPPGLQEYVDYLTILVDSTRFYQNRTSLYLSRLG